MLIYKFKHSFLPLQFQIKRWKTSLMKFNIVIFALLAALCQADTLSNYGKLEAYFQGDLRLVGNVKLASLEQLQIHLCHNKDSNQKCLDFTLLSNFTGMSKSPIIYFDNQNIAIKLVNQSEQLTFLASIAIIQDFRISKTFLTLHTDKERLALQTNTIVWPEQAISAKPAVLKKGRYSYYYSEKQQRIILSIIHNTLAVVATAWILFKKMKRSRTIETVLAFSDLIFVQYLAVGLSQAKLYIAALFILAIFVRVLFQLISIFGLIQNYLKERRYRQIVQAGLAYLFSALFPYMSYPLVLLVFLADDAREFGKGEKKLSLENYHALHLQLLSAIIYIPMYKILFDAPNQYPFNQYNYEWAFLILWLYMALIYEISLNVGLSFAMRKGKYFVFKFLDDYMNIIRGRTPNYEKKHKVCLICYKFIHEQVQKKILVGSCSHQFHQECIVNNKIENCPIDKAKI